jgi:hypothetical protein
MEKSAVRVRGIVKSLDLIDGLTALEEIVAIQRAELTWHVDCFVDDVGSGKGDAGPTFSIKLSSARHRNFQTAADCRQSLIF